MDDREDDDKRRVMTPPAEWGGDDPDDDIDTFSNEASFSDEETFDDVDPFDDEVTPKEPDTLNLEPDWDLSRDSTPPPADLAPGEIQEDPDGGQSDTEFPFWDDPGESERNAEATTADQPPETAAHPSFTDTLDESSAAADTYTDPDRDADADSVDDMSESNSSEQASESPPTIEAAQAFVPEPSPEEILTDHKLADTPSSAKLPWLPVTIAVIALILLVVGGWGVMGQRAELNARIAELELALKKRQSKGDLSAREEQVLRQERSSLEAQVMALEEENRALVAQIENLESGQLAAAEEPPATAPEQAADKGPANNTQAPSPETSDTSNSWTPEGRWFVNFASYSKEAIARSWGDKIRDDVDNIAIQAITVNGKALYRVRALGFSTQREAQAKAKALEAKYNLGKLWVGELGPEEPLGELMDLPPTQAGEPTSSVDTTAIDTPGLRETASDSGWFVYVDTYSEGIVADEKAQRIRAAGYDAKVSVEYRTGELFYRVQVMGIPSRDEGEAAITQLARLGDLPNLQLRQY